MEFSFEPVASLSYHFTLGCELTYLVVGALLSDSMLWGKAEGQPSGLCWAFKERQEEKALWWIAPTLQKLSVNYFSF